MEQVQKQAQKRDSAVEEAGELEIPEPADTDVDELLDEIDGVLEENAEAFIKGYVQKGGEASELSKEARDILSPWTLFSGALNVAQKFLSRASAGLTCQPAVAG